MAKKYLLYIHHPKFGAEEHKSELVNKLLNEYYSELGEVGTLYPVVLDDDSIVDEKLTPVETLKQIVPDFKPCKHGSHPQFCKFAKPGKPCK